MTEWNDAPDGNPDMMPGEELEAPSETPSESGAHWAEDELDPYDAMSALDPDVAEALQEEWGADFEANLALAQDAAGAIADDDLVELLEESGLGDDPRVIRAAARIGRLLQAGQGYRGDSPSAREELEETLDELSRRPDYWTDRVQRRVRQIHLALHGDR